MSENQAQAPTASRSRVGKVRNPWGVWALSLVTFGIYYFFWWYTVNQEVRDYDERIEVQPGLATLALVIPIAGLVSLVRTGGRIGQAQRSAGLTATCSGGIGFLLALLFSTHVVYYQRSLNQIWELHGNQPSGTPL